MGSYPDKTVKNLKYVRELFYTFYDLLIKLEELEKKYGVKISDNFYITKGKTLDVLEKKLSLSNLGSFFVLAEEIPNLFLFNMYFVLSDAKKREEDRNMFKKELEKFDKIVEGL